MAADVSFAIGIHTDDAKAGHDAIVKWNADIAGSYDKVLKAAQAAGSGLNIGAANGNVAGIAGLEKAVNGLSASMDKLVQSQAAFIKSAQESVQASSARTTASKAAAQAAETEAQAIDRISQRMRDAKAARDAQTQATTQQKAAQDALNASVAAGAGGQVSNAGLLATAKAAQDATVSVEKLTKARLDDEAASAALVKSADTLVGRYAPMIKAQQQLANDRAALTKLQKEGTLTAAEEAAVLSGLEGKQRSLDAMQQALGGSTKAQAAHFQSLKYQINDVVSGLIMGQPPMMIFVQQGGQIVQALQGMDISLKTVRASTLILVGGVVAVTAAVVAGVAMLERYSGSLRDFDNANRLAGNSVGMTRDQMAAYAETLADASGVSSAFARETVTAYTKLGGISASVMGDLIGITKDYAAVTGQSKDEAAAALGALFTDPAKGAQELATKYNMLSGAQLDYIRRLVETGQKTQAQTVLTEALGQRIKGAAEETSIWARAWGAVASAASNAASSIGRAVDRAVNGPSLEDRLNTARTALTALQKQAEKPAAGGVSSVFNVGSDVGGARAREQAQQNAKAAQEEIESLQELIRERNRAAAGQARDAQNNASGRAALEIATRYDDLGQSIRKAEGELTTLQKGLGPGMGDAAGQGSKAVEALQNQIADLNKVRASGLDLATYKSQELAKIDAKYAGQLGPQVAVQITQEKERITVLGTATTAAQRKAQVDAATASAQAGVTQAAAQATTELTLQTQAQERLAAAAGQGEAAQRKAAIENAVAAASVKGLGDATRVAMEAQEAATRAKINADFAGAINLEVAATERLVASMQKGAVATRDAEIRNEAYAQTLKEAVPTEADFGKKLADNIALLEKKANALDSKAFADYEDKLKAQTRQLELQQKLVGATPSQAARLQVENDINEMLRAQKLSYEGLSDAERAVIDRSRERALANAGLEQQIARQKDAYDTIANSLEKSFERVGDALVDAFVGGKASAVDFGNIAKGILSSLLTDLVKMSVIRPFSNAAFGTNYGTIFDLGGGSAANQNGGMGGLGGNALSLGSRFIPSSWTSGITGAIDQFGASALGIGSSIVPAVGGQAATVAATTINPATGSLAAYNSWGAAGSQGAAAGLSSYLGPLGGGLTAGMLLPSLFGIQNKAAGAAVGGAGGAATGAIIGSMIPGVGPLLGALLGGGSGLLGGLLGTQKPSVGPTASSGVNRSVDGKSVTSGGYLTDNGGDINAAKQLGDTVAIIVNAALAGGGYLTKNIGVGRTEKKGLYTGGDVGNREFGEDVAGMLRLALLDSGNLKDGGASTTKAIRNSKAKDFEEAAKDIALGASIDASTTALASLDKSLGSITKSAKDATAESLKPMLDELARAKTLDLGAEYVGLATKQLGDYLKQLKNPPDYTQAEQDMAALTGQFQALREAYQQLNPELVSTVDQIEKETRARIQANVQNDANRQLNSALGRDYVNSINDLVSAREVNARNLTAVGLSTQRASEIFDASVRNVLNGLSAADLDVVSASFGGSLAQLAQDIKNATTATTAASAAQEAAAAAASAAQEAAAQSASLIAQIQRDNAQETISALNEQKSAANGLLSSWKSVTSSVSQARQSLLVGDLSILDPRAKMDTSLQAYRDALGKAKSGDVDAAGQVSGLAQTALQAARAYFASNEDYARIFNEVTGGLEGVESVASRQVSLQSAAVSRLDSLIAVQQEALKALNKPAQSEVSSILSGLTSGNLGDLVQWGRRTGSDALMQVLQTADAKLGTAGNPYRYGAPGDVQAIANNMSTEDFLSVGRSIGFGGTLEALNPWIVAYNKQSAFEQAVKAWGSMRGYAAGTDYAPPGMAWVGEQGRELVQMAGGERVYPHSVSMDISRSWGAANDRWGGSNVMPFRGGQSGNSGKSSAEDKRRNELLEEQNRLLTALLRTTAAAGDSNNSGLQQVADGVSAVARKVSGGGATR